MRMIFFLFHLSQRIGNTTADIMNVGFLAFCVLFDQYFTRNFLLWEWRELWWCRDVGQ